MKTIAILALLMLIVTSGNTFAADDCAPALDFEKRRLAGDEVVNFYTSVTSPQSSKVVTAIEELL